VFFDGAEMSLMLVKLSYADISMWCPITMWSIVLSGRGDSGREPDSGFVLPELTRKTSVILIQTEVQMCEKIVVHYRHYQRIARWSAVVAVLFTFTAGTSGSAEAASSVDAYNNLHSSLAQQESILLQLLVMGLDVESNLLEALDLKELAEEAKKRKLNLESTEDKSAAIQSASEEDLEFEAKKKSAIDAAMAEKRELTAEQQQYVFNGFIITVTILMNIKTVVSSTVNVGLSMTQFVMSMINPLEAINFAVSVKAAGMKPKDVKKQLDSRFAALKTVSKRMDDTAKRNDQLLRDIMKQHKLTPPKNVQPKVVEASSAM
jgi:hypothetical protein